MLTALESVRKALEAQVDAAPGVAVAAAVAAAAGAVLAYKLATAPKPAHSIENIPLPPSTLPVLGNTLDVVNNYDTFHDWVLEQSRHFGGKPWRINVPGRADIVFITNLQAFEDVAKTQFDIFGKGEDLRVLLDDFLGKSMIINDGEAWRFQRKVFVGLFSARALRENVTAVIHKNALKLAKLFDRASSEDRAMDMFKIFNSFTIESFAEIGFGYHLGSLDVGEPHEFELAFDRADHRVTKRYTLPVWLWKLQRLLNIGEEAQYSRDMNLINTAVMGIIEDNLAKRARGEMTNGKDMISLALNAAAEAELQDPAELLSIAIGALVSGRDGTAQTLSWMMHYFAENPHVEAKVRAELSEKLPPVNKDDLESYFPSSEQVVELVYLEACIKETLRFYSSGSFNVKQALQDTFLSDGTFIPRGTQCVISGYAMGRLETIWGPDSMTFRPERFIDEKTGKLINMSATQYTMFHAGPRACPGRNVALLEIKIVMAGLLRRYKFAEEPGQTVTYARAITMPMRDPYMVKPRLL